MYFTIRFILQISTDSSGFQACQAEGFIIYFFLAASVLMTLILPLPGPNSAAHGHCWLRCRSDLLHQQSLSRQQRRLPRPALFLNPGWQKLPVAAGLSMFFVLPKVLGPAGWGRWIWHGVGSWDAFGKWLAAVSVPVLSAVLAKHQRWDLVLLLSLTQAELVQSECRQFQLSSRYRKKRVGEREKERKR